MKILVAIKSNNNAEMLSRSTLRWASRAGFNMRIFIPNREQLTAYQNAIDSANHEYYLDLNYAMIVVGESPRVFAIRQGYDLLLVLPDSLAEWVEGDGLDGTVLHYATDVGKARQRYNRGSIKQIKDFGNGAKMVKL